MRKQSIFLYLGIKKALQTYLKIILLTDLLVVAYIFSNTTIVELPSLIKLLASITIYSSPLILLFAIYFIRKYLKISKKYILVKKTTL